MDGCSFKTSPNWLMIRMMVTYITPSLPLLPCSKLRDVRSTHSARPTEHDVANAGPAPIPSPSLPPPCHVLCVFVGVLTSEQLCGGVLLLIKYSSTRRWKAEGGRERERCREEIHDEEDSAHRSVEWGWEKGTNSESRFIARTNKRKSSSKGSAVTSPGFDPQQQHKDALLL